VKSGAPEMSFVRSTARRTRLETSKFDFITAFGLFRGMKQLMDVAWWLVAQVVRTV
jgi:hypothetical protein